MEGMIEKIKDDELEKIKIWFEEDEIRIEEIKR